MSLEILHRVVLVRTVVSVENIASIFTVTRFWNHPSSQRGYASELKAKRTSGKGTRTVKFIRIIVTFVQTSQKTAFFGPT
jgi:hypothetical protein